MPDLWNLPDLWATRMSPESIFGGDCTAESCRDSWHVFDWTSETMLTCQCGERTIAITASPLTLVGDPR